MLSLYFVYLDMGLDTRVFVCICLLATLHTHSTRGYSLYSHLLYCACCNACNDRCGSRRTNVQQRLGHDLVLGLAGGNDACTPPGAVGFEFATGGMAVRTDVAWGLFVVS